MSDVLVAAVAVAVWALALTLVVGLCRHAAAGDADLHRQRPEDRE